VRLPLLLLLSCACTGAAPSGEVRGESAAAPPSAASPDSLVDLLEPRVPRAVAGERGWRYQQRASADLDGDGAAETAVLIADVEIDARGRPLWEHGHRWQVYVEEPDGARTYAYARFLPNGTLDAYLARPDSGQRPTILLVERTPESLAVYEVRYEGAGRAAAVRRLERDLERAGGFAGSPRP
jgi:hypothetical protein